jgi:hypothetical protein
LTRRCRFWDWSLTCPAPSGISPVLHTRDGLPVGSLSHMRWPITSRSINAKEVPIEELMYGRADYPAIGGVFRLTEAALISKLEDY